MYSQATINTTGILTKSTEEAKDSSAIDPAIIRYHSLIESLYQNGECLPEFIFRALVNDYLAASPKTTAFYGRPYPHLSFLQQLFAKIPPPSGKNEAHEGAVGLSLATIAQAIDEKFRDKTIGKPFIVLLNVFLSYYPQVQTRLSKDIRQQLHVHATYRHCVRMLNIPATMHHAAAWLGKELKLLERFVLGYDYSLYDKIINEINPPPLMTLTEFCQQLINTIINKIINKCSSPLPFATHAHLLIFILDILGEKDILQDIDVPFSDLRALLFMQDDRGIMLRVNIALVLARTLRQQEAREIILSAAENLLARYAEGLSKQEYWKIYRHFIKLTANQETLVRLFAYRKSMPSPFINQGCINAEAEHERLDILLSITLKITDPFLKSQLIEEVYLEFSAAFQKVVEAHKDYLFKIGLKLIPLHPQKERELAYILLPTIKYKHDHPFHKLLAALSQATKVQLIQDMREDLRGETQEKTKAYQGSLCYPRHEALADSLQDLPETRYQIMLSLLTQLQNMPAPREVTQKGRLEEIALLIQKSLDEEVYQRLVQERMNPIPILESVLFTPSQLENYQLAIYAAIAHVLPFTHDADFIQSKTREILGVMQNEVKIHFGNHALVFSLLSELASSEGNRALVQKKLEGYMKDKEALVMLGGRTSLERQMHFFLVQLAKVETDEKIKTEFIARIIAYEYNGQFGATLFERFDDTLKDTAQSLRNTDNILVIVRALLDSNFNPFRWGGLDRKEIVANTILSLFAKLTHAQQVLIINEIINLYDLASDQNKERAHHLLTNIAKQQVHFAPYLLFGKLKNHKTAKPANADWVATTQSAIACELAHSTLNTALLDHVPTREVRNLVLNYYRV